MMTMMTMTTTKAASAAVAFKAASECGAISGVWCLCKQSLVSCTTLLLPCSITLPGR
jgi:hypothetical protein